MKNQKSEKPNYFPRLPFVVLACGGILLLAANVILSYVLEDYPEFMGIIFFGVYSLSAVIILIVQSARYNYLNRVYEDSAAFNTEIIDMFKYVTDIPYAIVDAEGNAVVVNNALQEIIGISDKPLYNRPLSDFCSLDTDSERGSDGRFEYARPRDGRVEIFGDSYDGLDGIDRNSGEGLGELSDDGSATDAETSDITFGKTAITQKTVFEIIKDTANMHGAPLMRGRDKSDMSTFWSYDLTPSGEAIVIDNRRYEPRAHILKVKGRSYYFTTFTEIEDILEFRDRMKGNNVVVAYIVPDNLQEIDKNYQSGYREAAAKLEATLRRFARSLDGFLREYERDKYMLIFTHEKLEECRANNYRILSDVRAINVNDITAEHRGSEIVLTVSIGIADIRDSMRRREEAAKDALELAIRRGGDQVVTHTHDETEYFGGHLKETTGNTVIEAKNAAQQAWYYIERAENVYIMGHSFPDFDSIASCMGLARVACDILSKKAGDAAYEDIFNEDSTSERKKDDLERLRERAAAARKLAETATRDRIKIIVDRTSANFTVFYDMLMKTTSPEDREFYGSLFIGGNAAPDLFPRNTLLILSDVSNYKIVECPEVIQLAKQIMIIDHHRSAAFGVEPIYKFIKSGASSASEIIASMIEHGNAEIALTKAEATLMLAGIMLDTNKYSRNTTDLTFAAAQYLIGCGADQDEARSFFLDKYDVYRSESMILGSDVEIYHGIAIALIDLGRELTGDDRIAASKAADRLIGIQGINAAFALTKAGSMVNVSARSNGKINVQRITEKLGGGGHYNMAGAQIKDHTLTSVSVRLKNYIDEYLALEERESRV